MRFKILTLLVVSMMAVSMAQVQQGFKFNLLQVNMTQLVSHDRLTFSIDVGQLTWPTRDVLGWRVYFSRYEIGWAEPQYEYAAWSIPTSSEYLDRMFWIVKPTKLTGKWHIRVDAVSAIDRTIYGSTGDQTYDFGDETVTPTYRYTAFLPWVVRVDGWETMLSFTNTSSSPCNIKLTYRSPEGTQPVNYVPYAVTLQPYANKAYSIQAFLPNVNNIAGSLMIESTQPIAYMNVLQYQGLYFSAANDMTR